MVMIDRSCGKSTQLLFVYDDAEYLRIVAKRMAKRSILLTPVLSGTEAIQVLRRQDFDIVVLDLMVEDMDGIEVLKIVQKMAPGLPVIVLTGQGSETTAREGLALGAFDYLTKPCELEELLAKIEDACRGGGGQVERV